MERVVPRGRDKEAVGRNVAGSSCGCEIWPVEMEFLAGLPTVSAGILALIFLLIVFQEAVNGFHDTANAVATVIYSNA